MSEPMTPEREAELRLYCSLEMQDALKEIDRLRASQAAQELRMNGMKVESDLDYHSMREFQAKFITASQLVTALAEKCDSKDARVKELEEALREIHEVAARAQCEPPPDTGTLVNVCTIAERTWPVDRHASPNQDDVAEQSRKSREFMGGTK